MSDGLVVASVGWYVSRAEGNRRLDRIILQPHSTFEIARVGDDRRHLLQLVQHGHLRLLLRRRRHDY